MQERNKISNTAGTKKLKNFQRNPKLILHNGFELAFPSLYRVARLGSQMFS